MGRDFSQLLNAVENLELFLACMASNAICEIGFEFIVILVLMYDWSHKIEFLCK